jgi:DNA-binding NarL/FixJ family response regulator
MDVNMPRLNGVEATRRVTSELPEVRVVGLSVRDDEEIATAMRDAGAAAHIAKGGEADELFETIRGLTSHVRRATA